MKIIGFDEIKTLSDKSIKSWISKKMAIIGGAILLVGIVLFFENAKAMEAAYGLSIVITMIMTTILLSNFLVLRRYPNWLIYCILAVFLTIEFSFLVANLLKFMHGGYVTLIMAAILSSVMFIWMISRRIQNRYVEFTKMDKYLPILMQLSNDKLVDRGVKMIMSEIPVSYEKAAELLKEFGSVRKAVDYYNK